MAAGRRRSVEEEFKGRVAFERRTFLLMPGEGQRPAYDAYVVAHRVRAAEMTPELGFAIPKVGQPYPRSSVPPQLLALRVRKERPELLSALEDRLFGAMFRELRDISKPDVLRACARDAGIAEGEVEQALADPELKDIAAREHSEAVEEGITGIPALVIPGLGPIVGAVPEDLYRRALNQALAQGAEAGSPA
ncbi:MAG: hypothetical protein NVSMB23_00810 [Myxococcales bacterium]